MNRRCDFELFKSNICHWLKEAGDLAFIVQVLQDDHISLYYKKKWYPEAFYLLAMLDYISRENEVPLCNKYDSIRPQKLEKPLYPKSIVLLASLTGDEKIKEDALNEAIPEFIKHNIIEADIRNVV